LRTGGKDTPAQSIARLKQLKLDACRMQQMCGMEPCKTASDYGNAGVHR